MAETTSLLNWRTGEPYRGFESPSLRENSVSVGLSVGLGVSVGVKNCLS